MKCLVYSAHVPDRQMLVDVLKSEGLVHTGEEIRMYHTAGAVLKQLAENWEDIGAVVIADGQDYSESIIGACHEVDSGVTPIPVRILRNGLLETVSTEIAKPIEK